MRIILFASEEPEERPALQRTMISNRPLEHRIALLECVENGLNRDRSMNIELHLALDLRQCAQVVRKHDANHGSV